MAMRIELALVASMVAAPALAQQAPPPKLIVALSVDQLSSDLFERYRPVLFGGIGRLSKGTTFRNGYQGHNATETCPGHSTIMTGSRPSRTGIIANNWFDLSQARSDKSVYCAEDERVAGSSSSSTVSPYHLRVPTLGDLWKQRQPGARNVAVAGKDRSAVMMGGRNVDQRWYWDGKTFSTDIKNAVVPRSVTATRSIVANAIAQDRPALQLPTLCQGKARSVSLPGTAAVGAGAFARKAGDVRAFRNSPEFDGATLALAASLVDEMQLGRGQSTDILSVSLAGTDIVGHAYGNDGAEMCLQMFSLDRDLGDFFKLLDSRGIDYLVMLTADHGGADIPERSRDAGHPAASRVDMALEADEMGKALGAKFGLRGPVLVGEGAFGDIYVDRALSASERARVLTAAVSAYKAHPQVEAVFTREQVRRTPSPTAAPDRWSLIERVRASFDEERSGDFIVLLKRDVTPIPKPSAGSYVATHGSPWDYDRRVPILFWRRGMAASDRADAIETADIMPTLAATIGLPVDAGKIDGECLTGIVGVTCPSR
ncbi:alkaline phosphatase family protein [Sphingomonas sp. LY160]|uniref:alkaline phosphatase family protein n=1 Tax=Sphingomonas sp. LY160 TaxID=3095342 RepID=UPI002ADEC2F8|nr:alkaline phosphatase family protein [Sphingomonas sp. LY160]MEA1071066.1 alkaline phosphatase family protein [Sphingomonas sp. LY160]